MPCTQASSSGLLSLSEIWTPQLIFRIRGPQNPLNENAVKSIRRLVQHKPLHSLLLNLSIDLMLRGGDLLKLRVKDVITENGTIKEVVKIKQTKTGKTTIDIPLSDNSKRVIQEWLLGKEQDDFIFVGQKSNYTKKPITSDPQTIIRRREEKREM